MYVSGKKIQWRQKRQTEIRLTGRRLAMNSVIIEWHSLERIPPQRTNSAKSIEPNPTSNQNI